MVPGCKHERDCHQKENERDGMGQNRTTTEISGMRLLYKIQISSEFCLRLSDQILKLNNFVRMFVNTQFCKGYHAKKL